MWPFANSKTARRESVVRFALDAATLAFGAYLAGGRLARAMQSDAYVRGYVLARLQGLTHHAAVDARIAAETAALSRLVHCAFFGADACMPTAAPFTSAERERWLAGTDDGARHCGYLFGTRDVREHPRYADALQRERSAAAAMPGNRFNGCDAAVAHHLEHFTFAAYFEREHPLIPAPRICSSAA
jgi:hypothetical protein